MLWYNVVDLRSLGAMGVKVPRFNSDRFWRALWGIATSDSLLGVLLLTLALTMLLAAWLPQTSRGGTDSDVDWQAEVQRRFGDAAWLNTLRAPLQAIGAFHVTDAAGFRLLVALLSVCLLSRLVESAETAWGRWQGGDSARAEVEGRAGRWPWRELGTAGIYLGSLLVLLGASVTDLTSWQVGPFAVAAGDNVPLRQEGDLTLRLASLVPDGRRGEGEIWQGEALVAAGHLAMGQPLKGGGVGAYLVGRGTGLRVRAMLSDDQVLGLATGPDTESQEELALTFSTDEPRHLVAAPEADLILLLTVSESAQMDGPIRVQVFAEGSGEFLQEHEIRDDLSLQVRDATFALTPIPCAKVRVIHDRGAFWSQLGAIVLVTGLVLRRPTPFPRQSFHHRRASQQPVEGTESVNLAALPPASETLASRAEEPKGGGR